MKALLMNDYGDLRVLTLGEAQIPEPGPQQVQIQIKATGLNPVDHKIRQGHLRGLFEVKLPHILGGDIAGVITSLGEGAEDFKVGDEVFLSSRLDQGGGFAEYVAVDQSLVAHKPKSVDFAAAASLPVVGLTTLQTLSEFANLQSGMKVLIHAGAGGVGSFAIQYAKHLGATVFTTANQTNHRYLKELGADYVIDYKSEDFVEVAQDHGGMDIVLESIGGASYIRSIEAARPGAIVPCIVNAPDTKALELALSKDIKTDFVLLEGRRSDLETIARLVDQGSIRPQVSRRLKWEEIIEGQQILESGRSRAKMIFEPK